MMCDKVKNKKVEWATQQLGREVWTRRDLQPDKDERFILELMEELFQRENEGREKPGQAISDAYYFYRLTK